MTILIALVLAVGMLMVPRLTLFVAICVAASFAWGFTVVLFAIIFFILLAIISSS